METTDYPKINLPPNWKVSDGLDSLGLRGPCLGPDKYVGKQVFLGARFNVRENILFRTDYLNDEVCYWLKSGNMICWNPTNGSMPFYHASGLLPNRYVWDGLFVTHTEPRFSNDIMTKTILFACRKWDDEVESEFQRGAILYMRDLLDRAVGLVTTFPAMGNYIGGVDLLVGEAIGAWSVYQKLDIDIQ